MFKVIKYEDIDSNNFKGKNILIDVRSPSEYKSENIPGSINIPLFDDKERALIGKTYKQDSVEKSKKLGIKIASEKLPDIYDQVSELNKKYDKLIFFCARGGFRSSSLVSLFMTLRIHAFKLNNGYKAYRQYINKNLPKVIEGVKFVVLYGNTGAGKTDILKILKDNGKDVLDLEGCANHRGSVLGSVGLGEQNTQKTFESLVYNSLKNRKTDIVFVEGESRKVGKDTIPKSIYDAMNQGVNLCIDTDIEIRVDNILKDYVHGTDDELKTSINFLKKQLGNKAIDKYIDMIDQDEYRKVIKELMIKYYDPHYEYKDRKYIKTFKNLRSEKTTKDIIKWSENYNIE